MNIFALDHDPTLAAQYLCDQHLNKMILESAQMLCTVVHIKLPGLWNRELYKPVQPAHPCVRWLLEDQYNCEWLWTHCNAMDLERGYRWSKREKHASLDVASDAMNLLDDHWYGDSKGRTQFARVLPVEITNPNTVEAYRQYYTEKDIGWIDSGKQMKWTRRNKPHWFPFWKENDPVHFPIHTIDKHGNLTIKGLEES